MDSLSAMLIMHRRLVHFVWLAASLLLVACQQDGGGGGGDGVPGY
jgi:hypothetical protein